MKKNVRKPAAENASDNARKPDVKSSGDQSRVYPTRNTLRPAREDSGNLRRRSEWFSRRHGGE